MAIQPNELVIIQAQTQLGGDIGSQSATGIDQLFDLFTGQETSDGITDYACAYIRNDSNQTAIGLKFFVYEEDNFESVNVSVASGVSDIDVAEPAIPDINTPPAVTFVEASTEGAAISVGDLPAGSYKSIWFRMTIPAGTSATNYNYGIRIIAETGA